VPATLILDNPSPFSLISSRVSLVEPRKKHALNRLHSSVYVSRKHIRTSNPFSYFTSQKARSQHHASSIRHQPVGDSELGQRLYFECHRIRMRIKTGQPYTFCLALKAEKLFRTHINRKVFTSYPRIFSFMVFIVLI